MHKKSTRWKPRICIAAVLLLLLLLTPLAKAIITGVTIAPLNPIQGMAVNCSTQSGNPSAPVKSYQWQTQQTNGTCTTGWVNGVQTAKFTMYLATPGQRSVRVACTYGSLPGQPAPPGNTTPAVTFTPPKAAGVQIVLGFGTSTPAGTSKAAVYQVTLADKTTAVGPYINGTAQEKLTNIFVYGNPKQQPDGSWIPASCSAAFCMNHGVITDNVLVGSGTDWDAIPVNSTIVSYTQNLRIAYTDACGNQYQQSLGSVNRKAVKVDASNWQLQTF
jgi:hypothetical protein